MDWFNKFFEEVITTQEIDLSVLSRRLVESLLLGWLVAMTHRLTQGRRDDYRRGFGSALVMLTVILALITLVIGNSGARAFTLVGALAVVRFRTRLNDTRDTAYVMLAVAVGMAVGTNNFHAGVIAIPAVGLAAVLFSFVGFGRPRPDGIYSLVVRVDRETNAESVLAPLFGKHLQSQRCDGSQSTQKGTTLDLTYTVRLRDSAAAAAIVRELLNLPGVKAAELKRR
jgi:uncharacterized membrane protein YhiD involved in acid resistance